MKFSNLPLNIIKLSAKAIITILLFYWIFYNIQLDRFLLAFKQVDVHLIILAGSLWPLGIVLASIRWQRLVNAYDIRLAFKDALSLSLISNFFNNFLPGSIGGDSYKFIYLNAQEGSRKTSILSSLILDRGIGLFAMVLCACLLAPFFLQRLSVGLQISDTLGVVAYFIVVLIVFLFVYVIFLPRKISLPISDNIILKSITQCINSVMLFSNSRLLLSSTILSIYLVILSSFSQYFLFCSLPSPPSLGIVCFLTPLIAILESIPLSINSLGIREGAGVFFFSIFGIPAEESLLIFFMGRFLITLFSLSGGVVYLVKKNRLGKAIL